MDIEGHRQRKQEFFAYGLQKNFAKFEYDNLAYVNKLPFNF